MVRTRPAGRGWHLCTPLPVAVRAFDRRRMSGIVAWADAIDNRLLLVFFLLIVDAWAIRLILTSSATGREKVKWTVVVLFCPIFGPLFWYVLGPKPRYGSYRPRP